MGGISSPSGKTTPNIGNMVGVHAYNMCLLPRSQKNHQSLQITIPSVQGSCIIHWSLDVYSGCCKILSHQASQPKLVSSGVNENITWNKITMGA